VCTFDPEYASRSMAPSLTVDDKLTYVTEEFENLQDMLDGAEDCKWIYQALIQICIIHRVLSKNWPVEECRLFDWISQLRTLDPLRNGRWNDLEESLRLNCRKDD